MSTSLSTAVSQQHATANAFVQKGSRPSERLLRPCGLPYEVRIDGARSGRFDNIRDAIASARIAKIGKPFSNIMIADTKTGRMLIEVAARADTGDRA